ncbi:MAG: transcription antitermination factor NusB [Proteobacteria bacterium]|nr:transcription antitermination factor NusB [Pseudomonadota bacterium]
MTQTKSKPNIWARRKARRALVQAAYQWQFANSDLTQLHKEFAERALDKADDEFFVDILARMISNVATLDELLAPLLDRPIKQLDMVERGVLRLAAVELSERIDVPYRVVIDEYVELTKVFGSEDAYKFVNGVLDKLSAQQRQVEVSAHQEQRRE